MRAIKTPVPYVPDQRKEMPGFVLAALWRLEQQSPRSWWSAGMIDRAVGAIRCIPEDVLGEILENQRKNSWSRGMQHAKSLWVVHGLAERTDDFRMRLTELGITTCADMATRAKSPQMLRDMFLNYGLQSRKTYDPRFR